MSTEMVFYLLWATVIVFYGFFAFVVTSKKAVKISKICTIVALVIAVLYSMWDLMQ